jgi:hypothetical protein
LLALPLPVACFLIVPTGIPWYGIWWIAAGHGYEITGLDVLDAHDALTQASAKAGMNTTQLNELLNIQLDSRWPNSDFIRKVLAHRPKG